jgi:hypothetical protein
MKIRFNLIHYEIFYYYFFFLNERTITLFIKRVCEINEFATNKLKSIG